MGIDIYLKWEGQEEEERQAQHTGFSTTHGHVGYLREAYHGGPYATHILVREAFESAECEAQIPAAIMRERLTNVTEPARPDETASRMAEMIHTMFSHLLRDTDATVIGPEPSGVHYTEPQTVEECVRARYARIYKGCGDKEIEAVVQSYRDFVTLAERKEAETGKPCTVYASY